MDDKEKYYIAGILEGEGSFQTPSPSQHNMVKITLEMTDEDVVRRVRKIIGSGSICELKARDENWSPTWRLTVKGKPAMEVMRNIKALMGERRTEQIEEVLNSYDPHLYAESRSDYNRDEVKNALEMIENNVSLKEISGQLDMKYNFVCSLSSGQTWKHLTT